MRYLKGIEDYGLYYKINYKFELRTYIDFGWAGNIDDRKSISGGAFSLEKRLVIQTSRKQNFISQSNVEAEYVVVLVNYTDVVWIKQLLKGRKEEITKPVVLYCGNTSVINIAKNHVIHAKTKHIAIEYHYLRELVQDKEVRMEYVKCKRKNSQYIHKAIA